MNKRKSRVLGTLIVLAILAGVLIIPRVLAPAEAPPSTERLSPVVAAKSERGVLEESFRFTGHLKPELTTTVVSKTAGRVLVFSANEGDKVREGQILVKIEEDVARLQVETARAGVLAAQAQLQKANTAVRPEELESARASISQAEEDLRVARQNLDRTKVLYEAGSLAKARYEDAQNQVRSGETQLENARRQLKLMEEGARSEDITMAQAQANAQQKQLELAQLQLDNTNVRAPISGIVAKVHSDRGSTVGAGSALLTIVSDQTIFATLTVPERYYGSFYTDPDRFEARIVPVSYEDRTPFKGRITRVGEIIDATSRSFELEVAIDNSQGLLKPGMFVKAEFISADSEAQILVRRNALVLRDGKPTIYVISRPIDEQSRAQVNARVVEVLEENENYAAIRVGINEGELYIAQGNAFLEDGQRVLVTRTL